MSSGKWRPSCLGLNELKRQRHQPNAIMGCLTQAAITGTIVLMPGFNTLKPRQNGRHFADDIFNCIFLNENVWIPIKISLKFVPKGPINNILALVQIMAWRHSGNKPLSESMMVSLSTHICVTRPQWVKSQVTGTHLKIRYPQISSTGTWSSNEL